MTWNYRIVRQRLENATAAELAEWGPEISGEYYYAIHEAFYNEAGEVDGITQDPITVSGEDLGEIRTQLSYMLTALNRPVLDYSDLKSKS